MGLGKGFSGANVTKEMKGVCFLFSETAQKVGSREFELNEDLWPEQRTKHLDRQVRWDSSHQRPFARQNL
jgi:hypothetical protein